MATTLAIELDDSRRLTGKNLLSDYPGAIIDVMVSSNGDSNNNSHDNSNDNGDKKAVADCWQVFARKLLDAVGWQKEHTFVRLFDTGITVAISAPLDALYSACEVNEAALQFAIHQLTETPAEESFEQAVIRLKQSIAKEANPQLIALIEQAKDNHVPWLVDDDQFSLGYGTSCQTWPIIDMSESNPLSESATDSEKRIELPTVESINWQQYKSVPLALITGTNGKSTSVRITSQIIKQAGKCCGVTSTDFIQVGDEILDYGDYSGPGGARMLLRHPNTETAILEVARGGILRRGLPIDQVDAALITNIAEDHLGQYGINTVEDLAKAKAVVAKAVSRKTDGSGALVLNADDHYLAELAPELKVTKCWFSLDEKNSIIQQHQANGGAVCFVRDGHIIYQVNHQQVSIIAVNDIPMTLNGAAKHNIQNALGAVGLAKSLNIDDASITQALKNFSSNFDDNPGRGNQFEVNGAKIIMDFAHNVHSMNAMANTIANMPGNKKYLMICHAGDRTDGKIKQMTESALSMKPDLVVIAELEIYLRGRTLGEVPSLSAEAVKSYGLDDQNIIFVDSPSIGAQYILDHIKKDDLALMLVLSERDKVVELLSSE